MADLIRTCGRLMPSWKVKLARRAVFCCITKGAFLHMAKKLSFWHASFYPRSKERHHRCFKKVTSLSKDVVRDLFNSVYIKGNMTNS